MKEFMFYKVSAVDLTKGKRMVFNPLLYEPTNKDSTLEFANKIKKEFVKYYGNIKIIIEKHIIIDTIELKDFK